MLMCGLPMELDVIAVIRKENIIGKRVGARNVGVLGFTRRLNIVSQPQPKSKG